MTLLRYVTVFLFFSTISDIDAFVAYPCRSYPRFLTDLHVSSTKYGRPTTVGDRTLYEILGAPANATRAELKQKYVVLAKQSHPDAILHGTTDTTIDFTEIAAAWRILSDPKQRLRYDRSLRAEQFTNDVQDWAGRVTKKAAPAAKKFGQFAIPFLQKTTAATLASIQAAANDLSRKSQERREQSRREMASIVDVPITEHHEHEVHVNDVSDHIQKVHAIDDVSDHTQKVHVNDVSNHAQKVHAIDDSTHEQNVQIINNKESGFSTTIRSAVEAAQRAGRIVDSFDLREKSRALEARALRESERAVEMEKMLQKIAERRLIMALHTPGSGLTSAEALILWNEFNRTVQDNLTAWDRALQKHTIEYEIEELQECERVFMEAQSQDSQAQLQYQISMQGRLKAKKKLVEAEHAENEARHGLEEAKLAVAKARDNIEDAAQKLAHAEAFARKCDYEMEKCSLALVRQSEKVRGALREKEIEMIESMKEYDNDNLADQVSAERLKELKELRREERMLAQDSARLENKAARLFARANKLKARADELESVGYTSSH